MNTKITAKDFFLHLGAIASFYASVAALISLLFGIINYSFPKITNAYFYYFPSTSFQVATLIVAFPLFLVLSWLLQKSYASEPALREAPIRRWLAYVTLFIAGAVVAGDLITVIHAFLDGQELTTAFLLKVLTLLVIAGGVFTYFFREIRNIISPKERNIWRVVAGILVLGSIILGFVVFGSPVAQREYRYDMQKTQSLQNLQWQVLNYWQMKGSLPANLDELMSDPFKGGGYVEKDPQTGESYEYRTTGTLSFELCATFNRESRRGMPGYGYGYGGGISIAYPARDIAMMPAESDNWDHPAGRHCYTRTIDPDLYPVYPTR